jgi:subtilisin family serine protease
LLAALAGLACVLGLVAAPADATSSDPAAPALLQARPAASWDGTGSPVVPGALIVTTREATSAAGLLARLPRDTRTWRGGVHADPLAVGVTRVQVDPDRTAELHATLAGLPGVLAVEAEHEWAYLAAPNDPEYLAGRQWAHTATDAPAAWDISTGSRDVRIAVVDSGIDARHPELADRVIVQEVVQSDAVGRVAVVAGAQDNDACRVGHGTMVAGVAAAAGDNGIGIAGVAWDASVIDIALSSTGSCNPTDAKVVAALGRIASPEFQAANGRADVINLSLGGREPSGRCPASVQRAIDEVTRQDIVVVAAAGNDGDLAINVPAVCDGVIAVGATGRDDSKARYSGMARYLDLTAPGGDSGDGNCDVDRCVLTTMREGAYGPTQGTSFSAPYVSGVVALIRAVRPTGLSPDDIESILERNARNPAGQGVHDHRLGWGVVNAGAALREVRDLPAGAVLPPPRPHPSVRITGAGTTAAVPQAVAMSEATFAEGTAFHAVLAREDDFADALAGSSLAFGIGPLLFTSRTGGLAPATAEELQRTLRPGRTVYLLGGFDALDARLEADIRSLGLTPVRLSGPSREHTAVAVARQLRRTLAELRITPNPVAIVATRSNWPDAVAAGSIGSAFGLPILLTSRDSLHPVTAEYLAELARSATPPQRVYVIGGPGVVGDATLQAAATASRTGVARLSGPTRDTTALAVAAEMRRELGPVQPSYAVAVDLDRGDGFAHALSASALAGATFSVFVPVRGPSAPQRLTTDTVRAFCGNRIDGLLAGGEDLLPTAVGAELVDVLAGSSARC